MLGQAKMAQIDNERGSEEYPPEWIEDFKKLSDFVYQLADDYRESVLIRLFDPHSIQGMVKSLRYGIHQYPTFLVNGLKIVGLDRKHMDIMLEKNGAAKRTVNG
jgi:hypothetical protein